MQFEQIARQVSRCAVAEIPPASWLRVLDFGEPGLGLSEASAVYLDAGAQVIALRCDSISLMQGPVRDQRYHYWNHYSLTGDLSLAQSGALPHTLQVVVSSMILGGDRTRDLEKDRNLKSKFEEFCGLLVPGGVLSFALTTDLVGDVTQWLEDSKLNIKRCGSIPGIQSTERPLAFITACKRGELKSPKPPLLRIDRTACVDRDRVEKALDAPLLEGPLSTQFTRDIAQVDGSCARFEVAVRERLQNLNDLWGSEPGGLPWPKVTWGVCSQAEMAESASVGSQNPVCDVLAIFAHPDDEAIYAGCTLKAFAEQAPESLWVVLATSGEGGRRTQNLELRPIREQESFDGAKKIGVSKTLFLGLGDHGKYLDTNRSLPRLPSETLELWGFEFALGRVVDAIRQARPRVLLSFDLSHDPNYSLHSHHLALGALATIAFHQAANPLFLGSKRNPWAIDRHYAVVGEERKGSRCFQVEVDPVWKQELLQLYPSQSFSTQGVLLKLGLRLNETWWLVQARDGLT